MRTDLRYAPSDLFETFPFPSHNPAVKSAAALYDHHRTRMFLQSADGLTQVYNSFHDRRQLSANIQQLRDLHIAMDCAVAEAFGWSDLDLDHGFYETQNRSRFTISEKARREVLDRLLELNHQSYAEEVEQGLHEKKAVKKMRSKKMSSARTKDSGTPLFDQLS